MANINGTTPSPYHRHNRRRYHTSTRIHDPYAHTLRLPRQPSIRYTSLRLRDNSGDHGALYATRSPLGRRVLSTTNTINNGRNDDGRQHYIYYRYQMCPNGRSTHTIRHTRPNGSHAFQPYFCPTTRLYRGFRRQYVNLQPTTNRFRPTSYHHTNANGNKYRSTINRKHGTTTVRRSSTLRPSNTNTHTLCATTTTIRRYYRVTSLQFSYNPTRSHLTLHHDYYRGRNLNDARTKRPGYSIHAIRPNEHYRSRPYPLLPTIRTRLHGTKGIRIRQPYAGTTPTKRRHFRPTGPHRGQYTRRGKYPRPHNNFQHGTTNKERTLRHSITTLPTNHTTHALRGLRTNIRVHGVQRLRGARHTVTRGNHYRRQRRTIFNYQSLCYTIRQRTTYSSGVSTRTGDPHSTGSASYCTTQELFICFIYDYIVYLSNCL